MWFIFFIVFYWLTIIFPLSVSRWKIKDKSQKILLVSSKIIIILLVCILISISVDYDMFTALTTFISFMALFNFMFKPHKFNFKRKHKDNLVKYAKSKARHLKQTYNRFLSRRR